PPSAQARQPAGTTDCQRARGEKWGPEGGREAEGRGEPPLPPRLLLGAACLGAAQLEPAPGPSAGTPARPVKPEGGMWPPGRGPGSLLGSWGRGGGRAALCRVQEEEEEDASTADTRAKGSPPAAGGGDEGPPQLTPSPIPEHRLQPRPFTLWPRFCLHGVVTGREAGPGGDGGREGAGHPAVLAFSAPHPVSLSGRVPAPPPASPGTREGPPERQTEAPQPCSEEPHSRLWFSRSSCTADAEKDGSGASNRAKQFRAQPGFGDRRDGVISARTYFYANEAKCDQHMETFLRCIEATGAATASGFSAIKLTALGRPQFLLQFSEVLTKWRKFFDQIAAEQGQAGLPATEAKLEVKELQKSLENMGISSKADIQNWFTGEMLGLSGTVDLLDWNSLIDPRTKLSKLLQVPNLQTGQLEPLLSHFTEEEDLQMKRMLQRIDILAKRASEVGVRLMVDAEQTYFQPAISRLTLEMQRRFNTEKPLIFNTYQCYLK
ncbi:proline dehydrogenase 1, mitochondrial-like, partial [Gracilinanus agilis]|uniref:proline dehydrogenase 1, mitochondrial-like n=1 Tax=Gracilinanus agilis TaxID=191870 RepID=UPI001CFD804F